MNETRSSASEQAAPEQAVRELLRKRADRLKAPPTEVAEEANLMVGEFPVAGERYALPLESLRAAVPLKGVTPVPLSPPHVVGILRFQGQVISALSLSSLLGVHGWREDPAILLIVSGWGDDLYALDCEQVPKASALPRTSVERGRVRGHIREVTTPDMQQVNLIDLTKLLDRRKVGTRRAG